MKPNINELFRMSRPVAASRSRSGAEAPKPMTVARIDEQLGGQLGRPDMGFFKNLHAKRLGREVQFDSWKKIVSEKYDQLGSLAVDALKAEAALVRERLRVEWNHQYAILAEQAAVGEMTVARKLEAVLEAGREFVFGDRADALERVVQRHADGQLTDEDLASEIRHLRERYERILDEFVQIVEERRGAVRTAFRPRINSTGGL